ncbi:hypothetical protein E2C01_049622 [Portunus trituberculatus]|uniref:Uncharacterized protein n=1 Tax=Portunus trituberculatus TaxID=210409 RepID=A0A5B7GDM2_PORTR|nr:hypothetical protein [Portunus trituberculatus]
MADAQVTLLSVAADVSTVPQTRHSQTNHRCLALQSRKGSREKSHSGAHCRLALTRTCHCGRLVRALRCPQPTKHCGAVLLYSAYVL